MPKGMTRFLKQETDAIKAFKALTKVQARINKAVAELGPFVAMLEARPKPTAAAPAAKSKAVPAKKKAAKRK